MVSGMLDDIERLMPGFKRICDATAHDFRAPLVRVITG